MQVAQPAAFVTHRVEGVVGDWTAVEWRPTLVDASHTAALADAPRTHQTR